MIMAQGGNTTMIGDVSKHLTVSGKLHLRFNRALRETKLAGKCIVNFICRNMMGSSTAGYALLRMKTFTLMCRNTPADILLNMELNELDHRFYQFLADNTFASRNKPCIMYNCRKLILLQNIDALLQILRMRVIYRDGQIHISS